MCSECIRPASPRDLSTFDGELLARGEGRVAWRRCQDNMWLIRNKHECNAAAGLVGLGSNVTIRVILQCSCSLFIMFRVNYRMKIPFGGVGICTLLVSGLAVYHKAYHPVGPIWAWFRFSMLTAAHLARLCQLIAGSKKMRKS